MMEVGQGILEMNDKLVASAGTSQSMVRMGVNFDTMESTQCLEHFLDLLTELAALTRGTENGHPTMTEDKREITLEEVETGLKQMRRQMSGCPLPRSDRHFKQLAEPIMGEFVRVATPSRTRTLVRRWSISFGMLRHKHVRYLKYAFTTAAKMPMVKQVLDNASRRAAFVLFKMLFHKNHEHLNTVASSVIPNLTWLLPASFTLMASEQLQEVLESAQALLKLAKFKACIYPIDRVDLTNVPQIRGSREQINIVVMFAPMLQCEYLPIGEIANQCEIWFVEDMCLAMMAY